jgi:hypothetical protein
MKAAAAGSGAVGCFVAALLAMTPSGHREAAPKERRGDLVAHEKQGNHDDE